MCAFQVLNRHKTVCWHDICLNYSFETGSGNQIGDWSYIERYERSWISNRSGVGRAERGLVSPRDRGRSRRAGFERGCIRYTARIQCWLIGDKYALQSFGHILIGFGRRYSVSRSGLSGLKLLPLHKIGHLLRIEK